MNVKLDDPSNGALFRDSAKGLAQLDLGEHDKLAIGDQGLLQDSVGAALQETSISIPGQVDPQELLNQPENSAFAGLTNPDSSATFTSLEPDIAIDVSAEVTTGENTAQVAAKIGARVETDSISQVNNVTPEHRARLVTAAKNKAVSTVQTDKQQRSIGALGQDMVDDLSQEQQEALRDQLDQKLSEQQKQDLANSMADVMASRLAQEIDQPLAEGMEDSLQQDQELKRNLAAALATELDDKEQIADALAAGILDVELQEQLQEQLLEERLGAIHEGLEVDEGIDLTVTEQQELADRLADEQLALEDRLGIAEEYADRLAPELREQLLDQEIELAIEVMPAADLDSFRVEAAQQLSDEEKLAVATEIVGQLDEQQMEDMLAGMSIEQETEVYAPVDNLPVQDKVDIYASMAREGLSADQLEQLADNMNLATEREEIAAAISKRLLERENEVEPDLVTAHSDIETDVDIDSQVELAPGRSPDQAGRVAGILEIMRQAIAEDAPDISLSS